MRRAMPIDFVTHNASDLDGQGFRWSPPTYLRSISRISQNEFNGRQGSNWGPGDTYGPTRRMPQGDSYNGRNRRSDTERTFQRRNRHSQYRTVNCAVGGEVGGGQDNRDYGDEESDNSDYSGDRSPDLALLAENGDNGSSSELEIEEIYGGAYRVGCRGLPGE